MKLIHGWALGFLCGVTTLLLMGQEAYLSSRGLAATLAMVALVTVARWMPRSGE